MSLFQYTGHQPRRKIKIKATLSCGATWEGELSPCCIEEWSSIGKPVHLRNSGFVGRRPIVESFFGIYAQSLTWIWVTAAALCGGVFFLVHGWEGRKCEREERAGSKIQYQQLRLSARLCYAIICLALVSHKPDYSTTKPKRKTMHEHNRQQEMLQSENYSGLNWI